MAQEVQSNLQLVNTYAEILKSPRIIDDVAKRFEIFIVTNKKYVGYYKSVRFTNINHQCEKW